MKAERTGGCGRGGGLGGRVRGTVGAEGAGVEEGLADVYGTRSGRTGGCRREEGLTDGYGARSGRGGRGWGTGVRNKLHHFIISSYWWWCLLHIFLKEGQMHKCTKSLVTGHKKPNPSLEEPLQQRQCHSQCLCVNLSARLLRSILGGGVN